MEKIYVLLKKTTSTIIGKVPAVIKIPSSIATNSL